MNKKLMPDVYCVLVFSLKYAFENEKCKENVIQFCLRRYCELFLVWTLHCRFTFHRNMLFSKGWFWGGWKEKKHFWGNLLERIESFLLVGQISRIKRGPGVPFPRMQKHHKGGFQKTSWVKSLSSGQTSLGLCYDFFTNFPLTSSQASKLR